MLFLNHIEYNTYNESNILHFQLLAVIEKNICLGYCMWPAVCKALILWSSYPSSSRRPHGPCFDRKDRFYKFLALSCMHARKHRRFATFITWLSPWTLVSLDQGRIVNANKGHLKFFSNSARMCLLVCFGSCSLSLTSINFSSTSTLVWFMCWQIPETHSANRYSFGRKNSIAAYWPILGGLQGLANRQAGGYPHM